MYLLDLLLLATAVLNIYGASSEESLLPTRTWPGPPITRSLNLQLLLWGSLKYYVTM